MLTIEVAVIGLALTTITAKADAHQIRPSACIRYWEQAPPGTKWKAKQRCLNYVEIHNCIAHPRPVPRSVRVKGKRVNANQRHVIGWLAREAQRRRLPYVVFLSSIMATTQEASAQELDHGHDTSVGPFQLISDHGPQHLRETVEFSGNWYFNGAMKVWRRNPRIEAGDLAQAVEASAHPDAYDQWKPEARRTVAAVTRGCTLLR